MNHPELVEAALEKIRDRSFSQFLRELAEECEKHRMVLIREQQFDTSNYLSTEQAALECVAKIINQAEEDFRNGQK